MVLSCISQQESYKFYINRRMSDRPLFPLRKRLNTQILTKTELALEAIKKHDLDQSRINFYKGKKFNEKQMLNILDNDYSRLTPHKKIELEKTYHISLFTYSQEFYYLEMVNYVFPMRVIVKNVRNDGVLYIGYDQEYPGIYHQNKMAIFEQEHMDNQKNYDFKCAINKEMLINLKNKGNKMVKNVYFTFVAGSSLLMFTFKVQFLGFVRDERFLSEVKLKDPRKISTSKKESDEMQPLKRQKTEPIQVFKQFVRSKFIQAQKTSDNPFKVQEFRVFGDQLQKHFSKPNLQPDQKSPNLNKLLQNSPLRLKRKVQSQKTFKNSKNLPLLNLQKGEVDLKVQQNKRNRQILQISKVKQKQLREAASKFKRLIQSYQKTYNEENVRKRKLTKDIVLTIYSMIYVKQIHKLFNLKTKKKNMEFKIRYLCLKFIKKLKKKYEQTCNIQPYRAKRSIVESCSSITFQSKFIYKQSINKASKVLMQTLKFLKPMISVNNSLNAANDYRNKIKIIQRVWKVKYHGRIYCLLYFVDCHVEKTTKEYPHLQLFTQLFYKNKANRQICLDYIRDQSEKYRFIYDAYVRKIEEIDEIIEVNKNLAIEKPMAKSKFTLSKKPIRPMHRFFRNFDILKSMVRTWFEIQYKKYTKKSSQKYLK